jgi:hypothetical protein
MEKFCFGEEQPRVTVSAVGTVLLLVNGREKIQTVGDIPDENGKATTDVIERKVWEYDGVWLATGGITTEAALTAAAQKMVLEKITEWDTSSAVNGFILNGQRVWLDFELRDRVYQGNERLQRIGRTDTTLWLGKQCYNLSIEQAQNIISHIEAYAKDCYNVTAAHKKAVSEMSTVEEVLGYDYTAGYPEVLTMNV